ncbi:GLC7-interacting protein 4 [Wickerhamomyces ciferrii]|uniref:GLC7-interacting protein 4 n=1 Tax=Wickerhamomyces ciferrii (strain ATCC 14091 / BCRC 22168 / CBS 111 / JCM 3599 / NBRC 0793 / NRRL Y-1031 F-60-10) TaxID=1206466 RepID=K0KVZ0_WICCF|nr:GLC7-interacting protein 4 [Wickerhamomyces ciferrii]CCH45283.1 GLC7-interacting protein 4 [Wickerhamomyces ciferrii]
MNSAKAAAAASTPVIKGGVYLDSYDAKIIEYQYAIIKIEALIKHIKSIQIKLRVNHHLVPIIHYMISLMGPLFNVSDTLTKRVDQLSKLTSIGAQRKVAALANTIALNFELEDQEALKLKYDDNARHLLNELLSLVENAGLIYEKKLQQACVERDANRLPGSNNKPVPLEVEFFKDLLDPLELNVFPKLIVEASEFDNFHFKKVPLVIDSVNKSIKLIKDYLEQLKQFKSKPNDNVIKKLPHWSYTTHRIFACFVKLSELYTILRKFGRDLYLPYDEHLHNPKILHNNVKLELSLQNSDEYLKNTRKNHQLMTTLAKFTRQGSYTHLRTQSIVELTNLLIQSITLISNFSAVILGLLKNWELAEAKLVKIEQEQKQREKQQRALLSPNSSSSPADSKKKVEVLFNPEKEKLAQENIAKQQRERERQAAEERALKEKQLKEQQLKEDQITKRKFEERERQLRQELSNSRDNSPNVSRRGSIQRNTNTNSTAPATRIRSNSNSSISSASSNSSLNALSRTDSISSPHLISPTNLSRSSSLKSKRPASIYMSSPAFDIRTQLRRQAAATASGSGTPPKVNNSISATTSPLNGSAAGNGSQPVAGRRRSQSLQSSLPSTEHNNSLLAAAAGAAALKNERHSSLKSKSEVNHEQHLEEKQRHLQVKSNGPRNSRSPSPSRFNIKDLPNINELSLDESPSKLKRPLKSALANGKTNGKKVNTSTQSQNLGVPELSNESTSESSENTLDPGIQSPISNRTMKLEDSMEIDNLDEDDEEEPRPIIKKVRFTGVPDEVEEDSKPKRRGWVKVPPRLLSNPINPRPKSALSNAAASLQQEGVMFHNIKRGKLDVSTGNIVIPDTSNKRIMNTLAANTNNSHRLGRWKLSR